MNQACQFADTVLECNRFSTAAARRKTFGLKEM